MAGLKVRLDDGSEVGPLDLRMVQTWFQQGLIGPDAGPWKSWFLTVAFLGGVMLVIDLVDRSRDRLKPLVTTPAMLQGAFAGAAVVAIIIWSGQTPVPFIYFQF